MRLEIRPSLVVGIETIPLEDGQLVETSLVDYDEDLVNYLLHCVWWQGNNGDDVTFLEAVEWFFHQVARIPSSAPPALVQLLLRRVCGDIVDAQIIDDGAGAVSGSVGS